VAARVESSVDKLVSEERKVGRFTWRSRLPKAHRRNRGVGACSSATARVKRRNTVHFPRRNPVCATQEFVILVAKARIPRGEVTKGAALANWVVPGDRIGPDYFRLVSESEISPSRFRHAIGQSHS
jgi:hypothetical protein